MAGLYGQRTAGTFGDGMTDSELILKQQKTIDKLERKLARLEKRLMAKQKYETALLINTGATPRYVAEIHEKDRVALSDEEREKCLDLKRKLSKR